MFKNSAHPLHSLLVFAFLSMPASVLAQSASSGGTTFTSVSGSERQICAVETDGTLNCNQSIFDSRLAPPDSVPLLAAVTVGSVHACGLTLDGSAVCWGDNDFGQLNAPDDVQFTSLAAGEHHTCGITTSNDVVCWGLNSNGQTDPRYTGADATGSVDGVPIQMLELDLATVASCGLGVDGNIRCWGDTTSTYRPQSTAIDAPLDLGVLAFAVAKKQLPFVLQCALLSDGTVDCNEDYYTFNGLYSDIAAYNSVMCALKLDGDLECQSPVFAPGTISSSIMEIINEINAGEPLASIESGQLLCGLTVSSAIECIKRSGEFSVEVPGSSSALPEPIDLTAAIYSDSTVELLWSEGELSNSNFIAYAEIYRDGELFTTTTQLRSFLDNSLQSGLSYTYRVRYVGLAGEYSNFSSTITVNTMDRGGSTTSPVSGYTPSARPLEPTGLQASIYSQELLELQWSRVSAVVLGYEIRRDGQYVGYTTGVSYLDNTVSSGGDYVYEVIAVNATGEIQGVAMTRAVVD